ncbi:hypothetical protein [Bizionia myxarmorum]|uniref:GLPGLI family protein n=1 Tax=Bizionia myxarmorum TaxID=291186 RepID=A0A5D0R964_9FLAO|nr:hypothetical protein [Bizionia myxarmorum]TYB77134.1 hypothetical protein ES674_10625 [Bizionia myxarmorum]
MNFKLLLFLLFPVFVFSQKNYHFDYMLTYETTFLKEDSIKTTNIYLTNSKDNSYYANLISEDSLNYRLIFRKYDKISADVLVSKVEFRKAEFINIDCDAIIKWINTFKSVANHYEYTNIKDTLIQAKKYAVYNLKSTYSLKKKLKKHAGSHLYMVDTSYFMHMPMLIHPTAFERWKQQKESLPNGITVEVIFSNELDEVRQSKKLVSVFKIDKNIVTPGYCDYWN